MTCLRVFDSSMLQTRWTRRSLRTDDGATIRITYPGAFSHVVNRGLEQRVIFADKTDYTSFLTLLERLHASFGFRVHSYCLMPNHYHLRARSGVGS